MCSSDLDTVKDAVSEPDDYEPPVMIQSAPREVPGDPEEMWNIIAGEISRNDRSFMSFVAKHSKGTECDSGELVVTVKPNKLRLANDKLGEITRAAKGIYGPEIFVTLRGGDPDEDGGSRPVVSEQEASRIIDEDANLNDVLQDVENLFGIKPEVSN